MTATVTDDETVQSSPAGTAQNNVADVSAMYQNHVGYTEKSAVAAIDFGEWKATQESCLGKCPLGATRVVHCQTAAGAGSVSGTPRTPRLLKQATLRDMANRRRLRDTSPAPSILSGIIGCFLALHIESTPCSKGFAEVWPDNGPEIDSFP